MSKLPNPNPPTLPSGTPPPSAPPKFHAMHVDFKAKANAAAANFLASSGMLTPELTTRQATSGLGWLQIVTLVLQFVGQFGPSTIQIILDVAATLKTLGTGASPAQVIAAIEVLAAKDGPAVIALASDILNMLGISIPGFPPVTVGA
jgi:hypothetical protein